MVEEQPLITPEPRGAVAAMGGRGAQRYADVDVVVSERLPSGISGEPARSWTVRISSARG